jgi:hypothetical protein
MNALSVIMQKHMNIDDPIKYEVCGSWKFWQQYFKILEIKSVAPGGTIISYIMNYISFTCGYLTKYPDASAKEYAREKFSNLLNLLTNPFILEETKEETMVLFMKSQRTYYAFQKLAMIFKYKNMEARVYHDLCMNELDEKNRCVFSLIQNNTKYYFLISDLMGIIRRALLHESYFFAEPLEPKNPYNNLPFTHSDLYNIYFYMRKHYMIIPSVFQSFYMSNFDYEQFINNNEQLIREQTIHNYAFTSPYTTLMVDLPSMFSMNKAATSNLTISKAFPKDKLINIFRPYFHLYYLHRFGIIGTENKRNALGQLKKKLRRFVNFNQAFGRSIIRLKHKPEFPFRGRPKKVKHYEISMSYISFTKDEKDINSIDYLTISEEEYHSGNMRIHVNEQPLANNESRLGPASRLNTVLNNIIQSRRNITIPNNVDDSTNNSDSSENSEDSSDLDSDDEIDVIINNPNADEESIIIEDVGNLFGTDTSSSIGNIETEESNDSDNTMVDILNDDYIPFNDSQSNAQTDTNIETNDDTISPIMETNQVVTDEMEEEVDDEESIGFVIDRQGNRDLLQTIENEIVDNEIHDSNNATINPDNTVSDQEMERLCDEFQHMYLDSESEYDDYENDIDSIS